MVIIFVHIRLKEHSCIEHELSVFSESFITPQNIIAMMDFTCCEPSMKSKIA